MDDYSPTTLKAVKRLIQFGFCVTILASYNYKSIPDWFKYIDAKLFRNIYKRKKYVHEVLGIDQNLIKIISGNFWYIWTKSILEFLRKKVPIHNMQRNYVQNTIINWIDFEKFDAVYAFDTSAYHFQKRTKKIGLKNILQSRGMHFKYSLEVNKNVNLLFNTEVPDIDTFVKDEQSQWWYDKLITEPTLADFMVFYSKFHSETFLKYSEVNGKQSIIIPLPAGIGKSQEAIKVEGEVLKFVYAGNLSYVKGIPILLEAFKLLIHNYKGALKLELHIFGKRQITEVEQMLVKAESVIYHGVLDHELLMNKMKSFHVFVFPSLFDTFGMALAEALQNNLPVISNYTCGAAELYIDMVHGLKCKDSYSVIELMQTMKRFADKPELVEEYSSNLLKFNSLTEDFVNKKYEKELQKLRSFISEEVLKEHAIA